MSQGQSKDLIEDIRLRSDIVEVIGRYVPLKKSGARFTTCCPFHKEKTPSFQVDPHKQFFHCFGCGAGGDVFSFVMQHEHVEFLEAARILAERAGIDFERERSPGTPAEKSDRADLFALHEALTDHYAQTLEQGRDAEGARTYLAERQLTEAVRPFRVGYASPRSGELVQWARSRKIPPAVMEKAGVLLPSDRGGAPYDRFKGRLMFPICDEQGRVVGFSGRQLDNASRAKYVNSPETPLFKKSRLLYGLHHARQSMGDARRAIVCEGQIDVIRCHLAGFTQAVAPQGTALTEAHATLLKRYADEVILVFDADTAGRNAALRAGQALLSEGLVVRMALLPPGEDPDSLIRRQGPDAFRERLEKAVSPVAFQWTLLQAEQGEDGAQAARLRAARSLMDVIMYAPSAVLRDDYLEEAAALLNTRVEALRQDMARRATPRTQERADDRRPPPARPDRYPPQETTLIELMLAHPEVLDLVHQYVPPEAITHPVCRRIVQAIMNQPEPDPGQLIRDLSGADEPVLRLLTGIQMTARKITGDEVSCTHAAQDLILNLRIKLLDQRIRECSRHLGGLDERAERDMENERSQLLVLKKKLEAVQIHKAWDTAALILELDD